MSRHLRSAQRFYRSVGIWLKPAILAAAFAFSGCTQRGDLGRYTHPFGLRQEPAQIDAYSARPPGETTHPILYTDSERELRIVGKRLLMPVHADPAWADDSLSVMFREPHAGRYPFNRPARYYARVRAPSGLSQDVIWNRIAADIGRDSDTVTHVQRVAHDVLDDDARRARAVGATPGLAPGEGAAIARRRADNETFISHVIAAAQARLDVYRYALDRAAREAPSPRRNAAEAAFSRLVGDVEFLSAGPVRAARGPIRYRSARHEALPARPRPITPPPIVDLSLQR